MSSTEDFGEDFVKNLLKTLVFPEDFENEEDVVTLKI